MRSDFTLKDNTAKCMTNQYRVKSRGGNISVYCFSKSTFGVSPAGSLAEGAKHLLLKKKNSWVRALEGPSRRGTTRPGGQERPRHTGNAPPRHAAPSSPIPSPSTSTLGTRSWQGRQIDSSRERLI